jgi:hypothetical protein
MTETLLPQLETPDARRAAVEAVLVLFTNWRLHEVNQAELLGVAAINKFKNTGIADIDAGVLKRVGNLLAIGRALKKHYPYQPVARDQWIMTPQIQLNGETPLAIMLTKADEGIRIVRELAESLRNNQ